MENLYKKIEEMSTLNSLHGQDFLLSWNKSGSDMRTLVTIAEVLKRIYAENISLRVFDTGVAAALLKNSSLQTRLSYSFAASMLGLDFVDLQYQEFKNSILASVEDKANLISFFTDFIGISDDINISDGHKYLMEIAQILDKSHEAGILPHRPGIINLQCYQDFPTQSISDIMFLEHKYGGASELRKKKVVVSWAYSPNYDNNISSPQSAITMMTRLGMHVELCHPEGYDLSPEAIKIAQRMAKFSGGTFDISNSMDDSLKDADIVYVKSWVPHNVMEEHIKLLDENNTEQIENLKNNYLENSKKHIGWEYNEEKEKLTKKSDALVMTSLPVSVTGKSAEHGEISKAIYDKAKNNAYLQSSYKPYVIAAMMMGYKFEHPSRILKQILDNGVNRVKA